MATLDEVVQELRRIFQDEPKTRDSQIREVLTSYKSNRDDWGKYAISDPHRYTRNLVDQGNKDYNLIVICWNEGQGSSIHDHSDASCYMKILEGSLSETQYDWPKDDQDGPMVQKGEPEFYETDEVTYINDSIGLHRIENPSNSDSAVSLHLYCPPFDMCQSFDQRNCKAQKVTMTFWTQFGERTPFQPGSKEADKKFQHEAN